MAGNKESCVDCGPGESRKSAASRVFDTAKDLFYRRGIRAVGVDEIVCEAGVTKPSLYRAFKSKDDLVTACLTQNAAEGREGILAAIAAAGDDPRKRLSAVIDHHADKIRCPDYRGCPISNVAVEMPEPGNPGREVLEQCKTDFRAIMVDLSRDLDVAYPEALADGLLLVIEGAIATHHIFGSQGPALSLVETCESLIDSHMERAR
ncbi:MAG: TetR/AcrR family transcriptional regulator [Sphingobium sp.]